MSNQSVNPASRRDIFDEDELQRLRNEAKQMVSNGVIPLEDCSLESRIDDGQELADGENEAFRAAVREELDEMSARDATPDEEAEQGEGWGPTEVDFKTIWHEYDFGERVSNTQLVGALAYSDHTAFGKGGAKRAIEYGVEAGQIIDIPRQLHTIGGESYQAKGLLYAKGWSQ